MKNKLKIQRLGIEFEKYISDDDTINLLNEIILSNKNTIKTLIV